VRKDEKVRVAENNMLKRISGLKRQEAQQQEVKGAS
jgi:hypothetical protein